MLSLSALKTYLQQKGRVSLAQLTFQFNEERSVIEGMLSHFIRKGQLRKCHCDTNACGRCPLQCQKPAIIWFEWLAV